LFLGDWKYPEFITWYFPAKAISLSFVWVSSGSSQKQYGHFGSASN
jgi:hypothetical protein